MMNKFFMAAASASLTAGMQIMHPQPELFLQQHEQAVAPQRASSTTGCQFVEDYSWYNYVNLSSDNSAYTSKDTTNDATAYFTYCQYLSNVDSAVCSGDYFASIYVDSECKLNSKSITSTTVERDGESKFTLLYSNSDSSNNGVSELYVVQNCDDGVSTPTDGTMTKNADGSYSTSQTSSMACPVFTMNGLIQFIDQYKWFFGPGFIAVGIFFGFVGLGLFKVALFIVMTIAVAGVLLFICYATFLKDTTEVWVGWLMVGISVILGLVAGGLSVMLENYAAAILAGWGGFLLGVMLNETVLWLANQAWLFWVVNIVLALVFALLGYKFVDHAIVFATSFIGAYMMMKGIGIMAGGFPNIYVLIEMIKNGAIDSIDPVFYAYMAGVVIMTIVCVVCQWKTWLKKKQEKEAHPYNNLN